KHIPKKEAYELFTDEQERMVYFELDGYYKEGQTEEFEQKIVDVIICILSKMVGFPILTMAYKGHRVVKKEKDQHYGMWKLSIHLILLNLKCAAGQSMKPFYNHFVK